MIKICKKGYMGNTQNFEETVENLIDSKIEMYHNDRTGLPDYAIDTAGGTIIEYRSSVSMNSGRTKSSKLIGKYSDRYWQILENSSKFLETLSRPFLLNMD